MLQDIYTSVTVYGKMSTGENFYSFPDFSLNCKSFIGNRGIVD